MELGLALGIRNEFTDDRAMRSKRIRKCRKQLFSESGGVDIRLMRLDETRKGKSHVTHSGEIDHQI